MGGVKCRFVILCFPLFTQKAHLVAHAPQGTSAISRSPPCQTSCKPLDLLFTLLRRPNPDCIIPPAMGLSLVVRASCPCSTALTCPGCIHPAALLFLHDLYRQAALRSTSADSPIWSSHFASSVTTLWPLWGLCFGSVCRADAYLLWSRPALSPPGASFR